MKGFLHNPKSERLIISIIFIFISIAHIASPIITSYDSRWSIHTAVSMIEEWNPYLDEYKQDIEKQAFYAIRTVGGHYICWYPIGTYVLAAPFVYVFDKCSTMIIPIETVAPNSIKYIDTETQNLRWWQLDNAKVITNFQFVEKFVASIIVALTAVFIYLVARLFLKRRYSLLLVFIFAFCTMAWSTASRALWQHGASMLMLSIVLYLILLARKNPRLIQYIGIPLAFSYVCRPSNEIPIILLTIFIFIEYRKYFLRYILWAMPIAILFIVYNLTFWHSFLPEYYRPGIVGTFGVTPINPLYYKILAINSISPNGGLFIYAPIILFSFYGIFLKIRNKQMFKLDYFLFAIIVLHFLASSMITPWGSQYGPRFFTDMLPFSMYFMIPVLGIFTTLFTKKNNSPNNDKQQHTGSIKKWTLVSIFVCFTIISFLIHFRGATSSWPWIWNGYLKNGGLAVIWENPGRSWDWADMQILRGTQPDLLTWGGGFSALEGTKGLTWRWCSQEGTLVINNASHKSKKYTITALFRVGYPELSHLKIEGDILTEDLSIINGEYNYSEKIIVPPGKHVVTFNCDAKRLEAPADPRYLVFNITNFEITEVK